MNGDGFVIGLFVGMLLITCLAGMAIEIRKKWHQERKPADSLPRKTEETR